MHICCRYPKSARELGSRKLMKNNLREGVTHMNEGTSFSVSMLTLSIVLAGTAFTQNLATSPEERI